MTAPSQDFTIMAGDDDAPIFQVVDGNGAPLNISAVSDILWIAQRDLGSPAILSKAMTAGQITLLDSGNEGRFAVTINRTDTLTLSGFYMHEAVLIDDVGLRSTVSTGRMNIGRAPAWTYSGDPTLSKRDAVRTYIGDVDSAFPLLYDAQIDLMLATFGAPLFAAAAAARAIAAKFSRKVTKRVGDTTLTYSDLAKQFLALADELQAQGDQHSGVTVYAGGTSLSDMNANLLNPDRPRSPFWLWQFTNRGASGGTMPSNTGNSGC